MSLSTNTGPAPATLAAGWGASRSGGESVTLNCGYGHGSSVLELIAAVKRISGVDFKVVHADRRPGDPAEVVADAKRIRTTLVWNPQFDNLDTIVAHALAWEQRLAQGGG